MCRTNEVLSWGSITKRRTSACVRGSDERGVCTLNFSIERLQCTRRGSSSSLFHFFFIFLSYTLPYMSPPHFFLKILVGLKFGGVLNTTQTLNTTKFYAKSGEDGDGQRGMTVFSLSTPFLN